MAVISTCHMFIRTGQDGTSHLLHKETCEIVYDSILQNKEKTKNYWEKLMLATKMAAESVKRAEEPGGSVVERDIRAQREREEALAAERLAAQRLARIRDNGEGPHSIPTSDEGLCSESGDERQHSLHSGSEQEQMFNNYQRTPSFESMSSGHSSGSDGLAKRQGELRKFDDSTTQQILKIQKECPVEREIRISKERNAELKPSAKLLNSTSRDTVKADEIRAELESISLKKCVSMSNLPLATQSESSTSYKPKLANGKFRQAANRHSLTGESGSKIFIPSKVPRGLMKRFIESHGRLPTSFVVNQPSVPDPPPLPNKVVNSAPKVTPPSPPIILKSQDSVPFRRPGYRSAEDKIQMELREMKRREAELKQERARLLGRSQPNLVNIGLTEDSSSDDEGYSLPQMGKLRSALSIPNLTNERTVIIPKRCNELIDAWESMIQKKSED